MGKILKLILLSFCALFFSVTAIDDIDIVSRELADTYVQTYSPTGYVTGYFFKSDYSCTSFPPEVVFSFAVGACYANTSSGQNYAFKTSGTVRRNQLELSISTFWDAKCQEPQSAGPAPGFNTLCTVQNFNGMNYYGLFKYSKGSPPVITAPGIEKRYYQDLQVCTTITDPGSPSDRPYLVSWQATQSCNILGGQTCNQKSYPKYGSTFYETSQCTLPPTNLALGNKNFLSCFAGTETVVLSDGQRRPLAALRVGDRIMAADKAGQAVFSDVIAIPHFGSSDLATFSELITVSGRSIKLTADHLLMGGSCSSPPSLVPAAALSEHQCIMTVDGVEEISSIETVFGRGTFTVVTMDEFIYVNGVLASPFSWSHNIGSSFYSIHRYAFSVWPALLKAKWVANGVAMFADLLSSF